jgi:hypothetical protein
MKAKQLDMLRRKQLAKRIADGFKIKYTYNRRIDKVADFFERVLHAVEPLGNLFVHVAQH